MNFCPYVGLQPYSEFDQDYFFGRERDSRIISSNLYAAPLTVLYGPSGVGKSSILRAGVLPRLRTSPRTAVVIFDRWADRNLLQTLKARCLEAMIVSMGKDDIPLDLDLPLDEFLFAAVQLLGGMLIIILDQFEEYFLYHPESERDNSFDAEFARSVNREEIDVNFLISLREDTLSRLDRFRARIPNLLGNVLRLRHLDAASARDAIRRPLEVYNRRYPEEARVTIEEALVEELIQQVQVEKLIIGQGGRGVLEEAQAGGETDVRIEAPFLQLVLTRLWAEELDRQDSHVLRLETLQALGGAARIVQAHMDAAMNTLTREEQEIAASIFRYMVTPSGTKIAYTIADLEYYAKPTQSLRPVLEKLAHGDVRIMRADASPDEPGVPRYEIYHDVLAPAILDWRARYENGKQLLNLFYLLIEKDEPESALETYQKMVQQTPQESFLPERYEIQKILGKSDLGVSYLVYDREEQREVTATILWSTFKVTDEDLARFSGQMRQLSSPRISRFYGFDRYHDNLYMLNEYIDALSLRRDLSDGRPLPYSQALQIAMQVAEALEEGHEQGIPNLNLLPANILLTPEGAKLVSYGFTRLKPPARIAGRRGRNEANDYLAPEQLIGQEGDARSDIYALGTILYEMLTGHTPVGRYEPASEVNVEATESIDVLIDHARERDPAKRFASVGDMRNEIRRISLVIGQGRPLQYMRAALARISGLYTRLMSRKWLPFLLVAVFILLSVSLAQTNVSFDYRLVTRIIVALLLNSVIASNLCDWIVRTIARRRGLGSLIGSGGGMGAIFGLLFTLNLISIYSLRGLRGDNQFDNLFITMLAMTVFEIAAALIIMLIIAWITERVFKSFTSGFYWTFVALIVFELILTVLRQPAGLITP